MSATCRFGRQFAQPGMLSVMPAAISYNAKRLVERCAEPHGVDVIATVKDDAYGHGVSAAAPAMVRGGIDTFAACDNVEFGAMRKAVGQGPTAIRIRPALPREVQESIQSGLRVKEMVSSVQTAGFMARVASAAGRGKLDVCVAIDTNLPKQGIRGMGRDGLPCNNDGLAALRNIASMPSLRVSGLMAHFPEADGDAAGLARTGAALDAFQQFTRKAWAFMPEGSKISVGGTGMLLNAPALAQHFKQGDVSHVRVGAALYGNYTDESLSRPWLKPCMEWSTSIAALSMREQGSFVGYQQSEITAGDRLLATLPIGFAHGYPRAARNAGAEVLVNGVRCPVMTVSANAIVIDVTAVSDPTIGTKVVLVGTQAAQTIRMEHVAAWGNTGHLDVQRGITGVKRIVDMTA